MRLVHLVYPGPIIRMLYLDSNFVLANGKPYENIASLAQCHDARNCQLQNVVVTPSEHRLPKACCFICIMSNMLLVLSITFVIKICGVVCVQLTHFSSGDWKDIFIAHVVIIIKSEVSTFPIVIIFFRGRVSEIFVTSYPVTYCIYIPGKLQIVGYVMTCRSYSFVCPLHHPIIIIVQTYL